MNITHNEFISNRTSLFATQGSNQSQYLTPDYFLASSSNSSYYSKKYSGNHTTSGSSIGIKPSHQSKFRKISLVASVIMLSLGFLATAVEVEASDSIALQKKASSGQQKDSTFESIALSNNLPDVVPTLPLPDLIPSDSPVPPPPPPPMPPLPDIVPPVILPDVVPVPPAPPAPPMALSQPDLVSDATPQIKQKSGFLAAMKEIAKGNFKLKKVQQEPKPKVISSEDEDLMSQILARREAIAGEKKSNKFKKAAKQVIVLTAEEQKAKEDEIAKKIAANKEKAATLRKQKGPEWAIKAKQIEAEVEIEKQRKAAEHARAMREQKAKENGNDSSTVIAGIDPVLHHNIVADLRQEISALKEQLTLKSNVVSEGINDLGSNGNARSKRSLEDNEVSETKDQSTSTEDASLLEDRLFDESLKNWEFEEDEAVKKLDEVISTYSDSDSGYNESLEDSSGRKGSREVFVKFTKGAKSRAGIRNAIKYISRDYKLELLDSEGLKQSGKEDIEDTIRFMQMHTSLPQKYGVDLTKSLTFSPPKIAGVSKEHTLEAVRKTLTSMYPDNYFVMAYHTDTKNPHVHVIINVSKSDGTRIRISGDKDYGYDVKSTIKKEAIREEWKELTSKTNRNEYEVVEFGSSSYIS